MFAPAPISFRMTPDDFRALVAQPMLAPMLAVTDIPFRSICRSFGAGLVHTEMASMRGIAEGDSEAFRCAVFDPAEQPVSIQLVGSDPRYAAQAVTALRTFRPTMLDLNCGCPNDAICAGGAGSALLDHPDRMHAVISALVAASSVPVSVKVRMQGTRTSVHIRDIARVVEDAGAHALIVHARTRTQRYSLPARWEAIADAKGVVGIPVIGDGDIFSSDDAARMREQTGCDGVMIARGALGTPWIFRDIVMGRRCGIHEHAPDNDELRAIIDHHLRLLAREFGPVNALPRMRKHLLWYLRHHENFDALRAEVMHDETPDGILAAVARYFDASPRRHDPDDAEYRTRETAFRSRVLFWMHVPVTLE